MRLLLEIAAGLAAAGVSYCLTMRCGTPAPQDAGPARLAPQDHRRVAEFPINGLAVEGRATRSAGPATGAALSVEQQVSLKTLRNEIINDTAADMRQRGQDILPCLRGTHLAGAEKLRFSVDVVSSPTEATTGSWHFVEVADGEPLPESFATCAEHAFGGGRRVVAPSDAAFPAYRGSVPILYEIPAPSSAE